MSLISFRKYSLLFTLYPEFFWGGGGEVKESQENERETHERGKGNTEDQEWSMVRAREQEQKIHKKDNAVHRGQETVSDSGGNYGKGSLVEEEVVVIGGGKTISEVEEVVADEAIGGSFKGKCKTEELLAFKFGGSNAAIKCGCDLLCIYRRDESNDHVRKKKKKRKGKKNENENEKDDNWWEAADDVYKDVNMRVVKTIARIVMVVYIRCLAENYVELNGTVVIQVVEKLPRVMV
ncbi:hypothetical protein VNO77_18200 [Canavalia gladiata]|uniref:Uncharacterized protein n=1 Tax=Canavalia gladiata TaxID=3824 RepID=A0AAN9LKE5_CANGL